MIEARGDLLVEVAEPAEGAGSWREQFVHGLLDSMHRDTPTEVQRRVSAVLASLGSPARRMPAMRWRLLSGLAAAVVIVAVGIFGLLPERSAMAMVQDSIAASRKAGDRRFEIRVLLKQREEPLATATLDVRDPEHYVLTIAADNGEVITMGRDAQGDWAIKKTGEIDRLPPRWLVSHWTSFGGGAVVLMTVDDLLDRLKDSYDLTRGAPRGLAGMSGSFHRVTATRRGAGADPARVELWLDQRTNLVAHLEMFWNPGDGPDEDPTAPGSRRGPGSRPPPPPHDERSLPPHEHPRGDGAPPRGGRDGPMPRPPNYTQYKASARSAIFDLVQASPFTDAWFDPATHVPKESGH